ncbi:MAG: hemolysin family protein [Planctomycetota bacterium]|jgi:CBS domain containing-hemolysin-like protein
MEGLVLLGGAELPALWAAIFVTALAESALRFASLAKLEDELDSQPATARYTRYLEQVRPLSAFCVLVRAVCTVAFIALVLLRARLTLSAALAAAALLVAAEWTARPIGRKWSSAVLRLLLPPLYWIAWPLRAVPLPGRRASVDQDEEPEPEVVRAAEEEIRVAIEDGAAEGALETEEKEMIEGIMRSREVDVAQIMTPRTEMECLPAGMLLPAAVNALGKFRHSRVPVHDGTLDRVVGIVYVKDLLGAVSKEADAPITLREVMRDPLFVPETKTVRPLLQQFQQEHVQIAVVLDEYGGVSGLVTVEDIMEEIVGEIQDEYDQEDLENRIRWRPGGGVEVDARVRIDEVNDLFGVHIPDDEDYDTMGGYVTAHLARVPEPEEEFRSHGLLVRILQSDKRRVRRVLVRRDEAGRSD